MPIRLFNTLTKTKEEFTPINPANVRMYVCGPTVYDFAHIGNARPAIVFDVLYRLLRHEYGADHVTYVRNITDVDDKINARALRDFPDLPLNEAIRAVTEKTEKQYHDDVAALGCLPPNHEPRATENIPGMIAIIEKLIAQGHAYAAGGEVLFDIQSMPDYGALSRRKLDEQQAGARVAVDAHKKHPHDFVLWKLSSDDEPGWPSPWGRGRPGWHIECSAMSAAYLGNEFDIHGGGLDLIFPHHENEIAQSRCAHGTPVMANVWMHNGFLQVEGEKMSKSLVNFFTIQDLIASDSFGQKKWHGDSLRLNMLRTHYRKPIDWTFDSLDESDTIMYHWRSKADWAVPTIFQTIKERDLEVHSEFLAALSDDLNTPLALAVLNALEDAMWALEKSDDKFPTAVEHFISALSILGLYDQKDAQARLERERTGEFAQRIQAAIEARNAARAAKNWAESDRIRDELLAKGIVLKDGPTGTTWEVKR